MVTHLYTASAQRRFGRGTLVLVAGLSALWVGGCETSSSFSLGTFFGQASSETAQAIGPVVPRFQKKKVAFAPIIGAPSKISRQMSSMLIEAVEKQQIPVVKDGAAGADYTIRGYVVAAPAGAGTKLSYIWDVTDRAGKRAHRIVGEEFVRGKKAKDPWSVVDNVVLKGIVDETALKLAAWVPMQAVPAVAAAGQVGHAQAGFRPASATARPQEYATLVPSVAGAPGDGKQSLAEALKRQLGMRGVKLASKATNLTYTVKGVVMMGAPANGKQAIKIEWQVLDPAAKRVGTVSQKNVIPVGSLDGKWGKTADAAAAAAAQGILKLLPKSGTGTRIN